MLGYKLLCCQHVLDLPAVIRLNILELVDTRDDSNSGFVEKLFYTYIKL